MNFFLVVGSATRMHSKGVSLWGFRDIGDDQPSQWHWSWTFALTIDRHCQWSDWSIAPKASIPLDRLFGRATLACTRGKFWKISYEYIAQHSFQKDPEQVEMHSEWFGQSTALSGDQKRGRYNVAGHSSHGGECQQAHNALQQHQRWTAATISWINDMKECFEPTCESSAVKRFKHFWITWFPLRSWINSTTLVLRALTIVWICEGV